MSDVLLDEKLRIGLSSGSGLIFAAFGAASGAVALGFTCLVSIALGGFSRLRLGQGDSVARGNERSSKRKRCIDQIANLLACLANPHGTVMSKSKLRNDCLM
jgi:hypothetical protein